MLLKSMHTYLFIGLLAGLVVACGSSSQTGPEGQDTNPNAPGTDPNNNTPGTGTDPNNNTPGTDTDPNATPSTDPNATDPVVDTNDLKDTDAPLPDIARSDFIVVDQFGYLPVSEKIAVIRSPQTGYDAGQSFAPGEQYALIDAISEEAIFTAAPTPWNNGAIDTSSGDRAWWFDFSSVEAPGIYYVLDTANNARSAQFRISSTVYRTVLKQAVRAFFYQRAGFEKTAAHAKEAWADAASHLGPLQDKNARRWNAPNDASTERDLSGGWYDAGDYNKYTNWHSDYIVFLLRAWEQNPEAFSDDYDIPESGNGIPDIVDEARFGMDWLIKMQEDDGSVLSILSLDHASPPSAATGPSLYGDASTSATLNAASAFAYGALVFAKAGLTDYATPLRARAERAWAWATANPAVLFRNNEGATSGIGAGQQEVDDHTREMFRLQAAIHLYALTGEASYRNYIDSHYTDVHLIDWTFAFPFEEREQEMLLYYTSLPNATASVVSHIREKYEAAIQGDENFTAFDNKVDPYLAHIKDYTWGSNSTKSRQGSMYMAVPIYDLLPARQNDARRAAAHYLHYLHGVNPQAMVYLSNMYEFGAEKSANEFFHSWFVDQSPLWDRVGVSTYGPAPGFLTGGPNPSYDVDGCCPNNCGGADNNARCTSESISPPAGQPDQKSYKDFNTSWPLNSWSVTENSNGYQVQYIRLLANFAR
ncbi:MAG: glycoside hydrolase family 9 protein [Proteobacteria bacterium]|nr:glycoside hydrolase family 9 protein [Pseudomonadota bacterium]